MVTKNSFVRICNDRVEKYSARPLETARKYAELHRIATEHGFASARVLDVKGDHVVLERLHDIVSIRHLYMGRDEKALDTAIARAGEMLGHLHMELPPDKVAKWSPPPGFGTALHRYAEYAMDAAATPEAVLHCDYGFANLFSVAGDPRRLAVIDPCPNFGSTFAEWTFGPIHLDIGKMFACLEGQIPVHRQLCRPSRGRIDRLQRIFADGYGRVAKPFDIATAHAFAYAVAAMQFRRRYGAVGRLHLAMLYNRLRGNFPRCRKMNGI